MSFVNYVNKEINAKIVYYGPGLSGKTTNIVYIHKKLKPESRGKLISLATQTDRTLFFDFLPINMGEISGFQIRFHLYTVPGQIFYNTTRKMVLKGVDGIVFVADSQKQMLEDNLESLNNLEENLKEYGKSLKDIPLVIQYNKRDLNDAMDLETLHMHLNRLKAPFFEAVATEGKGVLETLTAICRLVMKKIKETSEFTEKEKERKEEKEPAYEKSEMISYIPEDYSDEAMKMLDLLGDSENEQEQEEKTEEEVIEEELELFEEAVTEEKSVGFEELNKQIFTQAALSYEPVEERDNDEMKVELENPVISEDEIEIPLKFSLDGKKRCLKIKLKFQFGEDECIK